MGNFEVVHLAFGLSAFIFLLGVGFVIVRTQLIAISLVLIVCSLVAVSFQIAHVVVETL